MTLSLKSRLEGGIYGLLIGDALGVPYEFNAPAALPPRAELEMTPPRGFARTYPDILPGTWSDDGAQALVLLHTMLSCGHFDARHFAHGLINWHDFGFMAVDGKVFDVGNQTARAIKKLKQGADPLLAGGADERDNGNGSLMRVLPLALWHQGEDAALIADAFAQSATTHRHKRSQLCCALYCLWARRLLAGAEIEDGWSAAVQILRGHFPSGALREEFERNLAPEAEHRPTGSGYVVDCLFSARHALRESDYASVAKAAVALGNDTDTTACVAAGLAGLRYGVEAIPAHWRSALRGGEILAPLLAQLLARRNAGCA